jgi:hypothetical protein
LSLVKVHPNQIAPNLALRLVQVVAKSAELGLQHIQPIAGSFIAKKTRQNALLLNITSQTNERTASRRDFHNLQDKFVVFHLVAAQRLLDLLQLHARLGNLRLLLDELHPGLAQNRRKNIISRPPTCCNKVPSRCRKKSSSSCMTTVASFFVSTANRTSACSCSALASANAVLFVWQNSV